MAKTRTPHARIAFVFVLAALGVGCAPTAMPLPMLAAGYSPSKANVSHVITPGGERIAATRSSSP